MSAPEFLNVDLDIESKSPLRGLKREFGAKIFVLFSGRMKGRYCLYLEIAGADGNNLKSQDAVVNSLCSLVERLSESGKRVWNAAVKRELHLGYEARFSSKHANRFTIRPNTLRRLVRLGANLAVTIYREENRATRDLRKRRRNSD